MKNLIFVFCAFIALTLFACGGKKNDEAFYDVEEEEEKGNPEKIFFLEDFYEKYFENFNDPEALNNLIKDKITQRADSIIKSKIGNEEKNYWKFFKPNTLDSIPEDQLKNVIEQVEVYASLIDSLEGTPEEDNYYDVDIVDLKVQNHTFVMYVIGNNGEFKIDSISNPDYIVAPKTETNKPTPETEKK